MLRRAISITLAVFLLAPFGATAEDAPRADSLEKTAPSAPAAVKTPAAAPGRKMLFVVETDEQSALESLNRVSGEIDLGFTYSDDENGGSENHYRLSPFAGQTRYDDR